MSGCAALLCDGRPVKDGRIDSNVSIPSGKVKATANTVRWPILSSAACVLGHGGLHAQDVQVMCDGLSRKRALVCKPSLTCRNEGVRGFFKGLVVNLYKVVPTSALTLVIYEHVRTALINLQSSSP